MRKLKAAAVVLALGLVTLYAMSSPAGAGSKAVPFHGRGTGTISVDTSTGAVTGEESGVISHVGEYTLRLQGVAAHSADGTVSGSGSVAIVAINGDSLTGTFTLSGDGRTQRVVVTITGGTGRFHDASGTLVVICVSGPAHQEGQLLIFDHECTSEGRISY